LKPNILFILIDGLRADKCYGDKKTSVTPHIDSLINNGVYFSQTICSAPVTSPSMSSIFTGLYPFESVVLDNGVFVMNLELKNYVQYLKELGYETHAIIPEATSLWGLNKIFTDSVEMYPYTKTMFNGNGKKILDTIQKNDRGQPWFYYIHLYDLYVASVFDVDDGNSQELHNQKYGNNKYERILSAMDVWIGKILDNIDSKNTLIIFTSDHGTERGTYDSDLEEYAKYCQNLRTSWEPKIGTKMSNKILKKFPNLLKPMKSNLSKAYSKRRNEIVEDRIKIELEKIEKEKLRPYEKRRKKSAAIITFETYDDRFKVPLCFCGYGISSHHIIPEQVRSIDIFPTIFDILNLKNLSNRGRSLSPSFFGKKLDTTTVLIESTSNSTKSITSNSIGVRTSHYKYFRDRDNATKNIHLYDLEIDPLEEKNIADEFPKTVVKMENLLNEEKSQKSFAYKKSDDLNEDEVQMIEEELKKLGYIN
jgi:arylsulfatase A-like enzyme